MWFSDGLKLSNNEVVGKPWSFLLGWALNARFGVGKTWKNWNPKSPMVYPQMGIWFNKMERFIVAKMLGSVFRDRSIIPNQIYLCRMNTFSQLFMATKWSILRFETDPWWEVWSKPFGWLMLICLQLTVLPSKKDTFNHFHNLICTSNRCVLVLHPQILGQKSQGSQPFAVAPAQRLKRPGPLQELEARGQDEAATSLCGGRPHASQPAAGWQEPTDSSGWVDLGRWLGLS